MSLLAGKVVIVTGAGHRKDHRDGCSRGECYTMIRQGNNGSLIGIGSGYVLGG